MSEDARAGAHRHITFQRHSQRVSSRSGTAWHGATALAVLWTFGTLLWGCVSSPADSDDTMSAVEHPVPVAVAHLPDYASLDPRDDPRQLSFSDLNDGPGSQELGASKFLREVGVMALLESYIINVPPSAKFTAGWDANKASVSNIYYFADADAEGKIVSDFESSMLRFADHATDTLPFAVFSPTLHDAFFEVLEACGRASAWPDVELFVLHKGRGGDIDPGLIEPTFGLSYFEYQQLRHQCARYAATYPTLDPTVRDKLLKGQREHYAKVILGRLDSEVPLVEIPTRYQAEIDDLRANGW